MIIRSIVYQAILWLITIFLFLSLLFLPRTTSYQTGSGGEFLSAIYNYSFDQHVNQFTEFFQYIRENEGLGTVYNGYSLTENIWRTFQKSMLIVIPALFLGFFLGVAKGIFDFRIRSRRGKLFGVSMTRFFLSVPDLFLIIALQLLIMEGYEAGILPHIVVYGSDQISVVLLDILFLAIYPLFYIANITYFSIRDEQGMDYIRTAFSKGTSSFKVLYRHVLKNCFVKILSHTNTITLYTLSNLFIVEFLTNYRGAAFFFYETVTSPEFFRVGMNIKIQLYPAAGYIILFTAVIFLAKVLSEIARGMVSPLERRGSD
ncbi:ABC transporter permease subunit [Neobacillus drentensis]|jgi:oligopeptide transport system permease protein|uniref:ABC transporter permease subunit n=1 Tax=Neobacillus drentensis TaxID=220684 RepID=UPI0030007E2A